MLDPATAAGKLPDDWRLWPPEAKMLLLEGLRKRQGVGLQFKNTYRNDPAAFARDCIEWGDDSITPYQEEILSEIPVRKRVSVRSPHGSGKTCIASIAALWFITTRDGEDWKVPTTASAWRQLTEFFWPEIHKWVRALKWDKIQREPFNQNELQSQLIKLSTGRAFAMASSEDELTEGAHADHLMYIFDEAKAIPPGRWDAAEGALMTGETYALAISTPGEPVGRFYDIQSKKPGYEDWWVRHVTLEECIAAGRITEAQARQRALQWGEQSAVYQNRVLGEFCASDEDAVIPLAWIEAANERWNERITLLGDNDKPLEKWDWNDGAKRCVWPRWTWRQQADTPDIEQLGVDIARSDLGDKTVIARRQGQTLTQLDRYHIADTQPIVGYVNNILKNCSQAIAVVDVIGIGSGPYDQLREKFDKRAVAFNASESSDFKDRSLELSFSNKRSAAWWHMREILDPAYGSTIALPPDDQLTGDLTAPHRGRMTSGGKLTVESKPEIRKRIGRSTDDGDACFVSGTLITTMRGDIPIQSVQCGDRVLTRVGWRPVLSAGVTSKSAQVMTVKLSNGSSLIGTPSHLIWDGKQFRPLDSFVMGDKMASCRIKKESHSTELSSLAIQTHPDDNIESTFGLQKHIESRASKPFMLKSGRHSMGQFLKAALFITKTIIHSITQLITWIVSPMKNIHASTCSLALSTTAGNQNTLVEFDLLRLSGMELRRAESGTVNTLKIHGKDASQHNLMSHVQDVAGKLLRFSHTKKHQMDDVGVPAFATTGLLIGNSVIGVRRSALTAVKHLSRLALTAPKLVPVVVVRSFVEKENVEVWNLEVEDQPEYFANGILVHNCVMAFFPKKQEPPPDETYSYSYVDY